MENYSFILSKKVEVAIEIDEENGMIEEQERGYEVGEYLEVNIYEELPDGTNNHISTITTPSQDDEELIEQIKAEIKKYESVA